MAKLESCIIAASDELGITKADAEEIVDRLKEFRKRQSVENNLASPDEDLRAYARNKAEEQRVAAAMARKHAALNVVARRKFDAHVSSLNNQGMSWPKAIQTALVGSVKGMAGARRSVSARRVALEEEWLDGMWREIKKDRPHLQKLITRNDEELMDDVAREMWEIKPGGERGLSGNADAEYLAGLMAKYMEASRLRSNAAGSFIGKLDGYIPQHHDADRLLKVSPEDWTNSIKEKLDLGRSFPDADEDEINGILEEVYQNIVTGQDRTVSAKQKGQRTGPASMAKSLSKSRVLHFRDSDAWLEYQKEFGRGNAVTASISHLHSSARSVAMMEVLGPNPRNFLDQYIATKAAAVRKNPSISAGAKQKIIDDLNIDLDNPITSRVANAYAQASGDTQAPASHMMAKRNQAVRSWMAMAKLGAATLAAVPTDVWSMAAELRFQGKSGPAAAVKALQAGFKGRSTVERTEAASLVETGFQQAFGGISARFLAEDTIPGNTAKAVELFFRFTGMTGWTESRRSAFQVITSQHFADNSARAYGDLSDRFRHLLSLHSIDEDVWKVARGMVATDETGKSFMVPELAREADIDSLVVDDLNRARNHLKGDDLARREGRIRAGARRDLETQLRSFLSDEARFGVLDLEDADRQITNAGTKPGTLVGEIVRYVMALKGFPTSFTRKILGRAFQGGGQTDRRFLQRADIGQISFLIAGMTIAGYVASTMKDLSKGRTPKDPSSPKTWMASAAAGGGLGIYGDFVFGHQSRFGNSALETVAGPGIGEASTLLNNLMALRDGEAKGSDFMRQAVGNTPFVNVWYYRAALDYLILRHLEEFMNPGASARAERRMKENFGQESILPR